MQTTLRQIRKHDPCSPGWKKLLAYLGKTKADDEPLPLLTVLKSNGFEDTLWTLRAVDGFESEIMGLAVKFARQVQHLMTDPRSITALDVAEKFLRGEATSEELGLAYDASCAAANAAAYTAAGAYAARAAYAAAYADAAADATCYAAYAAADATCYAVAYAARVDAADADDRADAADAARAKIRAAQEEALLEIITLEK